MTYADIRQRVYDIIDMPVDELIRIGYTKKIHRIFNEATFRIAHSILPNLRAYKFSLTYDKMPAKVTMPPDFISFADEQNAYINGINFILTDFIDNTGLILTGHEANAVGIPYKYINENGDEVSTLRFDYTVYYNALYPEIVDGGQNYKTYELVSKVNSDSYTQMKLPVEDSLNGAAPDIWSQIIGQLVPHYIAAQLLASDDKVRSIAEMNAFETLLATVNVERHERQREYRSVRGWY